MPAPPAASLSGRADALSFGRRPREQWECLRSGALEEALLDRLPSLVGHWSLCVLAARTVSTTWNAAIDGDQHTQASVFISCQICGGLGPRCTGRCPSKCEYFASENGFVCVRCRRDDEWHDGECESLAVCDGPKCDTLCCLECRVMCGGPECLEYQTFCRRCLGATCGECGVYGCCTGCLAVWKDKNGATTKFLCPDCVEEAEMMATADARWGAATEAWEAARARFDLPVDAQEWWEERFMDGDMVLSGTGVMEWSGPNGYYCSTRDWCRQPVCGGCCRRFGLDGVQFATEEVEMARERRELVRNTRMPAATRRLREAFESLG